MKFLLLILLAGCCPKKQDVSEIKLQIPKFIVKVGDCFRGRSAYYDKVSETYKVKEVGTYSALVERRLPPKKVTNTNIYTFNEIEKNLTRIDCLGDLKK